MITAKEAQDKTNYVIEERNREQLLQLDPIFLAIDAAIKNAINDGLYDVQVKIAIDINKWQENQLLNKYMKLKYGARVITDFSGRKIIITWAKELFSDKSDHILHQL